MTTTRSNTWTGAGINRRSNDDLSKNSAEQLYDRAARRPWLAVARELLSGKPERLSMLGAIPATSFAALQCPENTQTVPLAQIVGSLEWSRSQDFDPAFRPVNPRLKERWLAVAERRQAGRSLPPVRLIQSGAQYYVVDGHHRVSVERALGSSTIQACVTPVISLN